MIRPIRADVPDRVRLERLALALIVHGPTAATIRAVRPLARSPLWLEARNLLREHEFTEAEIVYLMNTHPRGCACWACVKALHRAVQRSTAKRSRKPDSV
jgi:hypothetical protein